MQAQLLPILLAGPEGMTGRWMCDSMETRHDPLGMSTGSDGSAEGLLSLFLFFFLFFSFFFLFSQTLPIENLLGGNHLHDPASYDDQM